MFGSIFNLQLAVRGSSQLIQARNHIKGLGEASYKTFDMMTRSLSKLDKSTGRFINRLSAMALGGGVVATAFKTLNYSLLQSNSLIKTNTILMESIVGDKGMARQYITTIQDLSASFGQDMNELMSSSRGLIQVMNQAGKTTPQDLERMLKLVMTMQAMDTENRGLSYIAFSFKEAWQGIGAGADFRSMKSRLEVNLGKTMEQAIVNAVKSGNVTQAVDLFEQAFSNIGIRPNEILNRIMREGLVQNLHRSANYITRFFQLLGEESYLALAEPFYKLNTFLSKEVFGTVVIGVDKEGKKIVELVKPMQKIMEISKNLSNRFAKPFVNDLIKLGQAIYKMRGGLWEGLTNAIYGTKEAFSGFIGLFTSFFGGLFGVGDTLNTMEKFAFVMKKMGDFGTYLGKVFKELHTPLNQLGESVNRLALTLGNLLNIKATATEGGLLALLAKTGLQGATVVTEGVNAVIGGADKTVESTGMGSILKATGTALLPMLLFGFLTRGRGVPKGGGTGGVGGTQSGSMNDFLYGKKGVDLSRGANYYASRQALYQDEVLQKRISNVSAVRTKLEAQIDALTAKLGTKPDYIYGAKTPSGYDSVFPKKVIDDVERRRQIANLSKQHQRVLEREVELMDKSYKNKQIIQKLEAQKVAEMQSQQRGAMPTNWEKFKNAMTNPEYQGNILNTMMLGLMVGKEGFKTLFSKLYGIIGSGVTRLVVGLGTTLGMLTLGFTGVITALGIFAWKIHDHNKAIEITIQAMKQMAEEIRNAGVASKIRQEMVHRGVNVAGVNQMINQYGMQNFLRIGMSQMLTGKKGEESFEKGAGKYLHFLMYENTGKMRSQNELAFNKARFQSMGGTEEDFETAKEIAMKMDIKLSGGKLDETEQNTLIKALNDWYSKNVKTVKDKDKIEIQTKNSKLYNLVSPTPIVN